jgi:lambda repressor-like predicted transcriptional regulator
MTLDISKHNPDPEYLKSLIGKAGISQREAARRIGVSERVMRQYLSNREAKTALEAPYPVQFCLEGLAKNAPG